MKTENKIAEKLEIYRQELLDIGLRGNTLLHFKPRVHSSVIIDEISIEIFKIWEVLNVSRFRC